MMHLNREFDQDKERAVVISDLTYPRVKQKWNYVCLFVDLFNREIIVFMLAQTKMHNSSIENYLQYMAI
jgi:putative transposase